MERASRGLAEGNWGVLGGVGKRVVGARYLPGVTYSSSFFSSLVSRCVCGEDWHAGFGGGGG